MDLLFYERNQKRYAIEMPVYVQFSIWNPFYYKIAKIIDFSIGGFKLEFIDSFPLKNIDNIILVIPLKNFDIKNVKKLKLKAEIKWQDPLHSQVGGTYLIKNSFDKSIIEKIILALAEGKK